MSVSAATQASQIPVAAAPASASSGGSGHVATTNASASMNQTPGPSNANVSSPQNKRQLPWRKIRRVCKAIASIALGISGSVMAYLALSTAMWSSAKDYRDDCRSQNSTYGHVSQACVDILNAVLAEPVGLSMFLSKPSDEKRPLDRRENEHIRGDIEARPIPTADKALLTVIILFAICYVLKHYLRHALRNRNLSQHKQSTDLDIMQESTPTWVGSSIPRESVVTGVSLVGEDKAIRHRGHSPPEGDEVEADTEGKGSWIPLAYNIIETEVSHCESTRQRFLELSPGDDMFLPISISVDSGSKKSPTRAQTFDPVEYLSGLGKKAGRRQARMRRQRAKAS